MPWKKTNFLLHTQTRSLCTLSPSLSQCKHTERVEAYHDSAGSCAGDPVLEIFTPSFLDFSGFYSSHSFHLEITIIKSSGHYIEFESLYFSTIIVFHPSCHSNRNHLSLWLRQIFQLYCACIFYIYHKICRARPVLKPEKWTMSKRIFNYTVLWEGGKKVRWNYALLYGSQSSQPKATHSILF